MPAVSAAGSLPEEAPELIAIFGPTGVGKTKVAIELANVLRQRGEAPVAISCDAMQVYRGLELISTAPTIAERQELEHRLVGILDPGEEFSVGRYAEMAHSEIDALIEEGRRPILVGGTGLYLRAALAELELRPPVPEQIRQAVLADLEDRGVAALHAELPPAQRQNVHPNDRKKVLRYTELIRAGIDPPHSSDQLWTARLRRPTLLCGLTMERKALIERIDRRIETMVAAGAAEEARRARSRGLSLTASKMIGLDAFAEGDIERARLEHRRYARRQLTWMRKMPGVRVLDCTGREAAEVAREILATEDFPKTPVV